MICVSSSSGFVEIMKRHKEIRKKAEFQIIQDIDYKNYLWLVKNVILGHAKAD